MQLRNSLGGAWENLRWNSGVAQHTSVDASAVLGRLLAPAHLNSEYLLSKTCLEISGS